MKELLAVALSILLAFVLLPAFPSGAKAEEPAPYPARYLANPAQGETVASLAALNDGHTFYTLEYTADYKLDEVLAADATNMEELTAWMSANLLKTGAAKAVHMGGGCSAFVANNADGQPVYGRNYDFVQNA